MIEERILDFLDGRLGHSDEEELLHTLALSPERRGMLKEHMRLRELSHGLARSTELTVPCPTTAGLFARLSEQGFTGPVPMPVSLPIAPILPTMPAAIPAATGFRYVYVAAGVIVAFLAGLSVSLLNSRSNAPTRFVHDTTVVRSLPMLSEAQTPTTSGVAPVGSSLSGSLSNGSSSGVSSTMSSSLTGSSHASGSFAKNQILNRSNSVASSLASEHFGLFANNYSGSAIRVKADSHSSSDLVAHSSNNDAVPAGSKRESANDAVIEGPIAQVAFETPAVLQHSFAVSSDNEKQRIPIFAHDDDAPLASSLPVAISARAAAGPVPTGPFTYVNSLSEATFAWKPLSWLVAKASVGMLTAYETVPNNGTFDANSGVRYIGVQSVKTFIPIGSLELGLLVPIFGKQFEFAGGLGGDVNGVIYPRASIFTSFALTHSLSMSLGVEAMTFTHDIANSFVQTKQTFAGTNLAVSDHATSERSGFIGPSIEFSWHP